MELKNQVKQLQQEYNDLVNLKKAEEENLEKVKEHLNNLLQAQEIMQEAAKGIQQQVHRQIADIVNKCLQIIFDDPYEFKINFTSKRGKTEAELSFIRNGKEIKDVGGGVIDVVSFSLRLCSILFSQKSLERIMILDEPFKNLSKAKGYLERIPEMILLLSEEFNIQFIQVTHIDELKIGKIIKLG